MTQKNFYNLLCKNLFPNEHIELYIKPAYFTRTLTYIDPVLRIKFKRYNIHSDVINKIIFRYAMAPPISRIIKNLYEILEECE